MSQKNQSNDLSQEELRSLVKGDLKGLKKSMNVALRGKKLKGIEPTIQRLGKGGQLPHWYAQLKSGGELPNLDGKTIGSVLEMLLVAILEDTTLKGKISTPLRINPARGIDLPDLNLGVKSPSTNYCTSEPFFSAYERLLGNECDCVVLLTDYQTAKKHPPLKLKILDARYLSGSQIADRNLCRIAKQHRGWLIDVGDAEAQRAFCFLAYVNQSDWRAKALLGLMKVLQAPDAEISSVVNDIVARAEKANKKAAKKGRTISESDIDAIKGVVGVIPHFRGILGAMDNWVTEVLGGAARPPNDNEWRRIQESPLNGNIGMSFALQWRYNFAHVFGAEEKDSEGFDSCEAGKTGSGSLIPGRAERQKGVREQSMCR